MRKGDFRQDRANFSAKQAHSAGVLAALTGYFKQKRVKKAVNAR